VQYALNNIKLRIYSVRFSTDVARAFRGFNEHSLKQFRVHSATTHIYSMYAAVKTGATIKVRVSNCFACLASYATLPTNSISSNRYQSHVASRPSRPHCSWQRKPTIGRRRRGDRGHLPPPPKKKIGKIFFGQRSCKIRAFC